MKKIIAVLLFSTLFSLTGLAADNTITEDFVVTKIRLNNEKKLYEISFTLAAGIYKSDKEFVECLQKSLATKKPAKVTYQAMGLKITKCNI